MLTPNPPGPPGVGWVKTCFIDLRYKDICVRDMKAVDIDTMSWEGIAADRTKWSSALKQHLKTGEYKLMAAAADKRARIKEGSSSILPETTLICDAVRKGERRAAVGTHQWREGL